MNQYLYLLFSRSPRRIRVIENILQNHRTQATLFWAFNYEILDWLGADRKLHRTELEQWLKQGRDRGMLQLDEHTAWLTPAGLQHQQLILHHFYQPRYSQWTWLTNPADYADRFSLGIQALSELIHGEKQYVPLSLSISEMDRVRRWLLSGKSTDAIYQEMKTIGTQLEQADPRLATLFAYELFGFNLTGWTIEQAAGELHIHIEEAMMMDRDLWLGVAHLVAKNAGPLSSLMGDLVHSVPISTSAWQTIQQFRKGKSIEEIARSRRLKMSTIREHLLEAAIIIPDALDWARILPAEQQNQLAQRYQGPVMQWQFQPVDSQDNAREFFYFRLFQIYLRWHNNG